MKQSWAPRDLHSAGPYPRLRHFARRFRSRRIRRLASSTSPRTSPKSVVIVSARSRLAPKPCLRANSAKRSPPLQRRRSADTIEPRDRSVEMWRGQHLIRRHGIPKQRKRIVGGCRRCGDLGERRPGAICPYVLLLGIENCAAPACRRCTLKPCHRSKWRTMGSHDRQARTKRARAHLLEADASAPLPHPLPACLAKQRGGSGRAIIVPLTIGACRSGAIGGLTAC